MKRWIKVSITIAAFTLGIGFVIPERSTIPVHGASNKDWNPRSFWYEPWGKSGVHKGIDIFAARGVPVVSSTYGVALYYGSFGIGGTVVAVLGPKWRIHYYAHLDSTEVGFLSPVGPGTRIGTVGTSGNAAGKPAHLHYTILSLLPYPWLASSATQGWKRMFFIDPGMVLVGA